MSEERCPHGRYASKCHPCRTDGGRATPPRGFNHGGATKADTLAELCRLLDIAPLSIGVGSSVPRELFDALATRYGVPRGTMPEVGEAVCRRAGLPWTEDCDSRGTLSGGGSTVTHVGLRQILRAMQHLP